jgi:hypothetical protein
MLEKTAEVTIRVGYAYTMNNSITLRQIGWSVKGTAQVEKIDGSKEIVKLNSLSFYGEKPENSDIISRLSIGNYPCRQIKSVKLAVNELYEKLFENYSFSIYCSSSDLDRINNNNIN